MNISIIILRLSMNHLYPTIKWYTQRLAYANKSQKELIGLKRMNRNGIFGMALSKFKN